MILLAEWRFASKTFIRSLQYQNTLCKGIDIRESDMISLKTLFALRKTFLNQCVTSLDEEIVTIHSTSEIIGRMSGVVHSSI